MTRAPLLFIAALCFVNAHFAFGHGLHKISEEEIQQFRRSADAKKLESHDRKLLELQHVNAEENDGILAKIRANQHEGHSRRLLAGDACASHITDTSQAYAGKCPPFRKKDESHWCSAGVILSSPYASARIKEDTCVADSWNHLNECCPIDSGAVAGLSAGIFAFVGIIAVVTHYHKCCCFRPTPVVNMQQPVTQQ